MSFNLRELMEIAAASEAVDYATARKSLPIPYLLESHNVTLVIEGGRIKAVCPFHDDSNPSLTVFGDELERWSCWSCGAQGDAVDMLKRFEPELVGEDGRDGAPLFRRVRELITEIVDNGWTGPSSSTLERKQFDIKEAKEIVDSSQVNPNLERIEEFIKFKREQRGNQAWPYTAEYLVETWGVGTWGSWLIIPFYNQKGELFAYKRWPQPDKKRFSADGSRFSGHMYGEHFPDDNRDVLIVEGESDAWFAQYHIGEEYRVLSVPTGAATTPNVDGLSGRNVMLAFDGDNAGSAGAQRWAEALEAGGANVRILPIPVGRDLSTAGDIRHLIEQAQPLVKAPTGLLSTPVGYVRSTGRGDQTSISNWIFVPTRALRGEGSLAFEGVLKPGGETAVIRTSDMSSDTKLVAWAGRYGRAWMGTSNDARKLLALLQSEAVFLPSGYLVTAAGLHGDTFVWPGGQIGPAPVVYVPPAADAHLEDKMSIRPGNWNTDLVHKLRDVQAHSITDPFLAWLAAAPLRPLMPGKKFPFVGVSGDFGAGKTETTRMIVQLFSGSQIEQTFMSTPHALRSAFAATNAFPVLAGERRQGARKDTLETGDQLLRQSWNMQVMQQGGLGSGSWAELTDTIPSAPIVVEGEDMFSEGSHVERVIPLHLRESGKNPDMFAWLLENCFDGRTGVPTTGFPHAWLTWLQMLVATGTFDELDIKSAGPTDLADRQRYTLGVLHFGWGLLQAFMSEHNDNLGEADFSEIIETYQRMNKQTPVESALEYCLGQGECREWIMVINGEVWVNVPMMYTYLTHPTRQNLFTLPGKVPFLEAHLVTKFGAEKKMQGFTKFHVIPLSRLFRD